MAWHDGFFLPRCVDGEGEEGGAVQFFGGVLDVELVVVEVVGELARLLRNPVDDLHCLSIIAI